MWGVRALAAAAAVAGIGLPPLAAAAQTPAEQPTQIQIQYHELVPAGGDSDSVFLKLFEHMQRDCTLVGKAFARKCTISQVNIYSNPTNAGDLAGAKMVNATATMTLPPETATPPAAK